MRTKRELERYLAREILGRNIPRKPPRSERKGPERNADYRQWIRTLPCCACGANPPTEAAHTGHDGGAKQKASDYSVIPLCHDCHTAGPHSYHGLNSSAPDFARRHNLDCARRAAQLHAEWRARRGAA